MSTRFWRFVLKNCSNTPFSAKRRAMSAGGASMSALATNGASDPQTEPVGSKSTESGERFAFFAAFRAAAEQAREEAGIDDRRGH